MGMRGRSPLFTAAPPTFRPAERPKALDRASLPLCAALRAEHLATHTASRRTWSSRPYVEQNEQEQSASRADGLIGGTRASRRAHLRSIASQARRPTCAASKQSNDKRVRSAPDELRRTACSTHGPHMRRGSHGEHRCSRGVGTRFKRDMRGCTSILRALESRVLHDEHGVGLESQLPALATGGSGEMSTRAATSYA